MADELSILGDVIADEKGRLSLDFGPQQKAALMEWVRRFKKPGPVTARFKAGKESKTVAQLRKVHALFNDIAAETENESDVVKFELKRKFLARKREVVDMESGEVSFIDYVPSLAELDKDEMSDFIERVHVFAGEFLGMTFTERGAA